MPNKIAPISYRPRAQDDECFRLNIKSLAKKHFCSENHVITIALVDLFKKTKDLECKI